MASAKRSIATTKLTASSVILDIEGTTSSISYVKDVLFPYVRNNLESYLNENWDSADFQQFVKALKTQAQQDEENKIEGVIMIPEEGEESILKTAVIDNIKWQMDNDRKTKSLKDLQGLIMEKGYKTGDLKGHVYEDVEQSLKSWVELDKSVYIYSSGSIHAQKLLYGHSEKGDLLPLIKGHFDTTVGMKGDVNSYKEILKQISSIPSETVFFTDVPTEARAAKEAGIIAVLVSREGNAPLSDEDKAEFQVISSFEEVEFEQNCKKRKTSSSESPVNIDNKEVVSCSLPIDENNKPLSPQVVSKNEKEGVDELMEVDESPSEKASNVNAKTSENASDTKLQEENSSEEMNKEAINSEVKEESSKLDKENGLCKKEAKQEEDIDNTIEDKKEEAIISESTTSASKDTVDIQCKNEIGNNEVETNNSDSKMVCKETSAIQSENGTDKTENLIENHKEESITSDTVSSNEVVDIKCKNEEEKDRTSIENNDVVTDNSQSKNIDSAVSEGEVNVNCNSHTKVNESQDVSKSVENPIIPHDGDKISDEGVALSVNEEKKSSSSVPEGNTNCNEETLKKKDLKEDVNNSSDLNVLNGNEKDGDKAVETEDDSKLTPREETAKEEALKTSAIDEDQQKKKEITINNGVESDNLEEKTVLKKPSVEIADETVLENTLSLKENGKVVESQNNSRSNASADTESRCNNETSQITEECNADLNLSKDAMSKTSDVNECVENSEKPLGIVESNGLKTDVPLCEKTEEKNNEGMNGLVAKENGKSTPDLKTEDGSLTEEALEGKKCNTSENTPVETLIEA